MQTKKLGWGAKTVGRRTRFGRDEVQARTMGASLR
jgi:hypothetical protein